MDLSEEIKIGCIICSLLPQGTHFYNDVKCMYECQEVSNAALHNFPRPQAFTEEIRNENQDQRKMFDPGGI